MISGRSIAEYVRQLKEQYNITGKINSTAFAEVVGVSQDELCYIMMQLFILYSKEASRIRDKYYVCLRDKEYLEKSLDEMCKSKTEKQRLLVKSGLPIAKKSARISEIRLLMKLGSTDEEIMRDCGVSRTTLWRYKKEMKEREQNGKI
ncbi:MAG: hypothetical protein IKO16_05715 [Lachnospiraceae bacterium]|nr:hypothetical protein [Lachnospiraceae bacterium]